MQQDRFESSTSHADSYSVQSPAGIRGDDTHTQEDSGCSPAVSLTPLERLKVLEEAAADRTLAKSELRALIMVNRHYNMTRGDSFPGLRMLARELSLTVPQVCRALAGLKLKGYLESEQRGQEGSRKYGRALKYTLRPPRQVGLVEPLSELPKPASQPPSELPKPASHAATELPEPASRDLPKPATLTGETLTGVTQAPSSPDVEAPSSPPHMCVEPPKPAVRKPARTKPEHSLPEDWQPDEDLIQRCVKTKGLSEAQVRQETEQFLNYYLGNPSKRWADWNRCWWNWMNRVAPGGAYHKPVKAAGGNERVRANNLGLARPLTKEEMRRKPHVPVV
jgi:hypothetical protein